MDAGVVPNAREHGVKGETDKHRDKHRHHDGQTKLVKELSNDTFHESNGQEHGDDRESGGQHCQANFSGAFHGCGERVFAHLHMAHNVFAYHDGVVNQQTNAQRQGHEGHHIDGEAKQAHEQKSANHRNRQSQPGDDG